ncbi:hypothetical protein CTA1_8464 [Colletotrichum tanaceti]|uniref:Uncharacterized protein n=1 Tax=Colletotrichum tanaceti TaxID=1306861 RepID=A0A4U6XEV1_9PEZI|nr:hypothetical protein CTA1_8464 [Colletotrichum tanaceti]
MPAGTANTAIEGIENTPAATAHEVIEGIDVISPAEKGPGPPPTPPSPRITRSTIPRWTFPRQGRRAPEVIERFTC